MERAINPILEELLRSPQVQDIVINRFDCIYINQGNGFEKLPLHAFIFHSDSEYKTWVLEEISKSGKTWDAKLPFLDTVFFNSHRAHISFPPLSAHGIVVSLRKLPTHSQLSPEEAQFASINRWKDSHLAFSMLVTSILKKETVIFAGATGSGKTTLFNDLLAFLPENDRIISLEDTAELCPQHQHWLSLLSRQASADGIGEVKLRDLVKQTLRMRPDRILIGECRGDEVLDLLLALNTGHHGTLSTIHANSAKDALKRIELLALLAAKGTIPSPLIKELIAHGIQKIVFLKDRTIHTILNIEGLERDLIFSRVIYSAETKPSQTNTETQIASPRSVAAS